MTLSWGVYKSDIPTGAGVQAPFSPTVGNDTVRDDWFILRTHSAQLPAVAVTSVPIRFDMSFTLKRLVQIQEGTGLQLSVVSTIAGQLTGGVRFKVRRIY
jgi:hypothetical protein